jgi:hypothetical protein
MAIKLPKEQRTTTGPAAQRSRLPNTDAPRIQWLRRSATTPVSVRALLVGAVAGPIVGFAVNVLAVASDGQDRAPFEVLPALMRALWYGVPAGAASGALVTSLRRPTRRPSPGSTQHAREAGTDAGSRPSETEVRPRGIRMQRRRRPADFDSTGRVSRIRGSSTTPVSLRLMAIGAAVGTVGGFLAGSLDPHSSGDPRWLAIHALTFGAPTGAMAGAFFGALRRPPRS